ncbi:hypothetical protein, partial [Escherichia coli]|uniref:hypothetical protein n=2 Tax=Gammaproteobacteria TaxID=1236 RepID=UPI00144446F5
IYYLDLTSTQRNYRLKMGKPIADLIVQQDIFDYDVWYFILMVTTKNTRLHAQVTGLAEWKQSESKTGIKPINWDKETKNEELKQILDYFKDKQDFKFLLNKEHMTLKFAKFEAELVRMSHKTYVEQQDQSKKYKTPNKNYSWTWRYTEKSYDKMKMDLKDIINRYISQKNKEKALNELSIWQQKVKRWSVFKGTRSQAGHIQSFGRTTLYLKTKKTWKDENLPELKLTILPRLTV